MFIISSQYEECWKNTSELEPQGFHSPRRRARSFPENSSKCIIRSHCCTNVNYYTAEIREQSTCHKNQNMLCRSHPKGGICNFWQIPPLGWCPRAALDSRCSTQLPFYPIFPPTPPVPIQTLAHNNYINEIKLLLC